MSAFQESAATVGLRQDLSALNLAWGVDYERETYAPLYRLDQVEREQEAGDLQLWVETTAFAAAKIRVCGAYLADEAETRERRFFDPDRNGAFDGFDARRREEGKYFGVELSGSF